ncbi:PQQ-binding-like beta-propeller repeat protein [Herbivorax sp. ANBcel31]|uniref:outer membrane protein assembly factor BamB family protein n=1 Tax=Herbivorax sp. ANBcel31 TaxID=3069754 RepID=UPI0027B6FCC5|nr:PQQ-binding-like beta-propeller repeat protein [Herbivorax sp. ANBcel31]MDQ2086644.1 PQQ-binding-like beta-propeller repeat protein [Herbivorax sp. ANBcel31]
MKASKIIIFINTLILILCVPGFIFLNRYLSEHDSQTEQPQITSIPSKDITDNKEHSQDNTTDDGKTTDDEIEEEIQKEIEIVSEALPSNHDFTWDVLKNSTILENYKNEQYIDFDSYEKYNNVKGITTFRGNNYRNTASYGYVDATKEKLEKVWNINIGHIDSWTGVGWNGQPVIVKWEDTLREKMNLYNDKKNLDNLKEVIYGTLDGNIYFLDLDDGSYTRDPINVGAPLKGSVTVDPRGYPLLYSGQGVDVVGDTRVKIGFRIFSLIDQELLYFLDGIDQNSYRLWGAFDSTPLLHEKTDTLFECGENGLVYSIKLNTNYDIDKGKISIDPDVKKYRYTSPVDKRLGIESSIAAYKNYGYFADNSGTFTCIDLNTLTPVWVRNVTDDTDSTPAIEDKGGSDVFVYTANEVDLQGEGGYSYVRKLNALSGELIWEKGYECTYNSRLAGGALASPVIGKEDIDNLVIYKLSRAYKQNGGKLIALDKETGDEVWVLDMDFYSWSSPVDVYTKDGKSYIIQCDSGGNMFLIEGTTGKILDKIPLGANVEGSPAVYDDMIVVGTRGQQIWGVKIK